ncbi:hypothetical protein Tco_0880080 [Tanacetum coccineum]
MSSRSEVFPLEVYEERLRWRFMRSTPIGCSRGAPLSEVHDGCLHRSSRGAPPSEVHDECLYWKFTRSACIEGLSLEGFDRTPHKSVSFGSTTKMFQEEKTQGFDRKTTQGFDRRGVPTGVSLSKGFQPRVSIRRVPTKGLHRRGSNRWSPTEGFLLRVSIGGVSTEGLYHRGSNRHVSIGGVPTEGLHQRDSIVLIGGCPIGEVLLFQLEVARLADTFVSIPYSITPLIKELGEEADALPTIAPAKAPHSCNHIKSPRTQDTSTEDVPSDRGSEGFSEGKDATTNKLNEDADPNGMFQDDGFDDDDDSLSSHLTNMKGEWGKVHAVKLGILKKELFKDPKVCKAIINRVPTPTDLLRAKGLTLKDLSDRMIILMCLRFLMEDLEKERLENKLLEILAASKQDKESFAKECHYRALKRLVLRFLQEDFEGLVQKLLESGEFTQAPASVFFLAVSADFERGMHIPLS